MYKLLVHGKVQNVHPQDVSLLREGYFELKSIQILEVQEILLRESIPRQVYKKFGGPRGERGLGCSRRRQGSGILKEEERTNFFFSSKFLSLSHIKQFFPLSPLN